MRSLHPAVFSVSLLLSTGPARADVPDPSVHAAAVRLDAARASVYRARALQLSVASPSLLAERRGRVDPPAGDGWRVLHSRGHEVSVEDVAEHLHRGHELEAYDRATGPTTMFVGAAGLVVASGLGIVTGILNATGGKSTSETTGAIAGVTGGASLVTLAIGWIAHAQSERLVPLSVGAELVSSYNQGVAEELGAEPLPQVPADRAAAVEAEPQPEIAAPSRPVTRASLGLRLLESDGLRVVEATDARSTALRAGDLLLALDGISMPSLTVLNAYLARLRPGDVVVARVRRAGADLDVSIHL